MIDFFYPHSVSVEAVGAGSGLSPGYDDAQVYPAEVKGEIKLVRDRDGAEVVSSATVTVPLSAVVPVGSLVTLWPGTDQERRAEVIAVERNDNRDMPGLDSFLLLSLT